MADLAEILQQAMANPQIMSQIAALAQNLGMQGAQQAPSPAPPQPEVQPSVPVTTPQPPIAPAVHTAPSVPIPQMDARQLMGSLLNMTRHMGGDEPQLALIHALKPFVRPERARKLEQAIQVARMSRLAGQALSGLSGNFGQAGEHHV